MLDATGRGAPPPDTCSASEGAGAGLSVLVVEDDLDAGTALGDLLALFGHRVRVAHSGAAGVAAATAEAPQVLICDLGLPDLSGLQVIRRLREDERTAAVYAVALTGYARPRDRDDALRAGFDAHIVKPQELEDLQRVLARARERVGEAAAWGRGGPRPVRPG